MICCLNDAEEAEIAVINDYWLLADDESNGFLYTLKQIKDRYKSENVRSVGYLVQKSIFLASHPAFTCHNCNRKIPDKNRTEYTRRVKRKDATTCIECLEIKQQHLYDETFRTLKEYKARVFQSEPYLNKLTIKETLGLLSISAEQIENSQFLGGSLEEITITGIQSIDQKIL